MVAAVRPAAANLLAAAVDCPTAAAVAQAVSSIAAHPGWLAGQIAGPQQLALLHPLADAEIPAALYLWSAVEFSVPQ